jgi:hypothetical protein
MKFRLTGIREEDLANSPGNTATAAVVASTPVERVVVAELTAPDVPGYYGIRVPYNVIEGARVGDEFTLHLERA